VFRDNAVEAKTQKLFPFANHTLAQFLFQLTPATIWIFFAPFILGYYVYGKSGLNLQSKMFDNYKMLDERFIPF